MQMTYHLGEFWQLAYHPEVLIKLCQFRTAMLDDCMTPARVALRGIILGALHGPQQKTFQSYFSNQCPRTYAPKPNYAIQYWRARKCVPLNVDVIDIIKRRANRYYASLPSGLGEVRLGDSRKMKTFMPSNQQFAWVITSPPYYGMYTYVPDQWLRYWFLGGDDQVNYINQGQLIHSNPDDFTRDLRCVWDNSAKCCESRATMVVRFGGIAQRRVNPLELVKSSFLDSAWTIRTIRNAGSAIEGKRQADTFLRNKTKPMVEYDIWAKLM